jgi:2-succinyl-5-enolpyruvyl-6-hydroxy-3-cyclohexene-1-carboxylate synthase
MKETNDIISYRVAISLVDQLVRAGVTALVASPGYRNSPLLLAAHRNPELKVYSAVEERGAGFLALGLAKAGTSAALLCTSGTAVANYYPAVMEASHSHVPLVVITADRPAELIGTGANQCTDQTKVFGTHVRSSVEVLVTDGAENHARYALGRAAALARAPLAGPVHVNVRFREPFLADTAGVDYVNRTHSHPRLDWKFIPSAMGPSKEQWEALQTTLQAARRPLVVLGAGQNSEATLAALFSFSEKTGFPILAESASGLPFRSGRYGGYIARGVEPTLLAMAEGKIPPPDLVIRFGAPLTGKGLGRLFEKFPAPQVLFDEAEEAREPHLHPSICVQGGIDGWINALHRADLQCADSSWRDSLLRWEEKERAALGDYLSSGELTEWVFHHELAAKLSPGANLFLGNSMPIRDFNRAFAGTQGCQVFTNRGLSGIDGLIATATGIALSSGRETHAVIGDLSTLHDLPSLALAAGFRESLDLTIWVMNNGGGEIFKTVGTARTTGELEWFTTPQTFDLASLAKAFQIPFARVASRSHWNELEATACRGAGVRLIEVLVDPATNLSVRQKFRFEG